MQNDLWWIVGSAFVGSNIVAVTAILTGGPMWGAILLFVVTFPIFCAVGGFARFREEDDTV